MRDIGRSRRRPKKSKNPLLFDVVLDPQNRVGSSSTDPFASYPRELNDNEQELVNYSTYINVFGSGLITNIFLSL
jgi:hypothetical protein